MGPHPAEKSDDGSPEPRISTGAVRGAKVLLGRDLAGRIFGVLANVVILRVVTPSEFGLASIGLTSFGLASFVSTLGLVAAFLRRPEPASDPELRATLGIQLLLSCTFSAAAFLASPILGRTGLLIAVMVSPLPLFAFRTPASIRCGHALDFRPIALSTVGETAAFYVVTGVSAAAGLGVWSFALGMWARALIGTIILLRMVPAGALLPQWRPALLRPHMGFATGYQISQVTQLGRDQMVNILIGSIGGFSAVGYWSLATRLIQPLTLVYSALAQVALPSLARLTLRPLEQARAAVTSLSAMTSAAALSLVVLVPVCPFILQPLFGPGWSRAAQVFPTSALAAALAGSFDAVIVAVLLANGKARSVALAHAVLASAWLIMIPIAYPHIGVAAAGVAYLSATFFFCTYLFRAVRDLIPASLLLRSTAPIPLAGLLLLSGHLTASPSGAWQALALAAGLLAMQGLIMMAFLPSSLAALNRVFVAFKAR